MAKSEFCTFRVIEYIFCFFIYSFVSLIEEKLTITNNTPFELISFTQTFRSLCSIWEKFQLEP